MLKSKNIFLLPSCQISFLNEKWFKDNNKKRKDLSEVLDRLRVVKNEFEVDLMRKSAEIAANAHIHAMRFTKKDIFEYEIEGEILNQFYKKDARNPAYSSIVASVEQMHALLHYIKNNSQLKDGQLLLIDAGCEVENYASDITRTYPVNGKFSPAQKEITNWFSYPKKQL